MGAAKNNPTAVTAYGRGRFSPDQVSRLESDRGAAFAVAVERLRGWPVHTTYVGDEIVRFQAEDASDWVYDPRGIFTSARFSETVLLPLIGRRRDWPPSAFEGTELRVGTRCVGAEGLADLGVTPEEAKIVTAISMVEANAAYLDLLPHRPEPRLPAKVVSRYSWSGCVVYAEALARVTGLPAVTMAPTQIAPGHTLANGRFHAVVLHPDGAVEDVWGRQSAEAVGRRYAMVGWTFDADAHRAMIEDAYRLRPAAADDVARAEDLIRQYRGGASTSRTVAI